MLTKQDLDDISNKLYITADDIRTIAPMSKADAYALAHSIIDEMEAEGLAKISHRPILVPTHRVLAKLGISYHAIENVR